MTLDDLPSGTYVFKITDNETGVNNFSPPFELQGDSSSGGSDGSSTTESPSPSTTPSSKTTTTEEQEDSNFSPTTTIAATSTKVESSTTTSDVTHLSSSAGLSTTSDDSAVPEKTTTGVDTPGRSDMSSPSSSGLSKGAKAGISIGGAVGGIAIFAILAWFFYTRGKAASGRGGNAEARNKTSGVPELGLPESKPTPEIGGNPVSEMSEGRLSAPCNLKSAIELP